MLWVCFGDPEENVVGVVEGSCCSGALLLPVVFLEGCAPYVDISSSNLCCVRTLLRWWASGGVSMLWCASSTPLIDSTRVWCLAPARTRRLYAWTPIIDDAHARIYTHGVAVGQFQVRRFCLLSLAPPTRAGVIHGVWLIVHWPKPRWLGIDRDDGFLGSLAGHSGWRRAK